MTLCDIVARLRARTESETSSSHWQDCGESGGDMHVPVPPRDISDTPSVSTCELDNGPMGNVLKSREPEKSREQEPRPQLLAISRGIGAKSP